LLVALLLESVIGYIALGFAAYAFGWMLFWSRTQAFVLSLLTVTSYPIFRYGLDYYTETGIWAFYFATLACAAAYMHNPLRRYVWIGSVCILLGLLWKEYILLAALICVLAVVLHPRTTTEVKMRHSIEALAIVGLPWVIWQYAVYSQYGYTYLDWLRIGSDSSAYASEYTLQNVVKSLFATVLLVWPLALYGALQLWSRRDVVYRFCLYALVPSFGFLLWGYVSSRLFFSIGPLLIVMAVVGLWSIQSVMIRLAIILLLLLLNSILILQVFPLQVQPWLFAL